MWRRQHNTMAKYYKKGKDYDASVKLVGGIMLEVVARLREAVALRKAENDEPNFILNGQVMRDKPFVPIVISQSTEEAQADIEEKRKRYQDTSQSDRTDALETPEAPQLSNRSLRRPSNQTNKEPTPNSSRSKAPRNSWRSDKSGEKKLSSRKNSTKLRSPEKKLDTV